jgi:folylpolyglutamate synthase
MPAARRCITHFIAATTSFNRRPNLAHPIVKLNPASYHLSRHTHKMATPPSSPPAAATPPPGQYILALARLAALQSNRAITSLFDAPAPAAAPGDGDKTKKPDLNALAIPEMLAWLRRAGYTPASLAASGLRCVHVAGTKGKGSVSAQVAECLRAFWNPGSAYYSPSRDGGGREAGAEGRRVVGLYTSPHVLTVRERIMLDGEIIPTEKFARYVVEVWDRLTQAAREEAVAKGVQVSEEELEGPATKPFYFRFLTIVALHAFVSEGVRDAVIECGIGGEYDSTNVLPAEAVTATVVTQLGIDHVGMLGDTVEKIAWHKSGIFKPGAKAFTRRLEDQPGVMEVLRARAEEKGADLVEVRDEEVQPWEGVPGTRLLFQKYNMALAVHAAREHLLCRGEKLEGRFGSEEWSLADMPAEFATGLSMASLRGRCEEYVLGDGSEWYVDGAHTADSLAAVGQWFAAKSRSRQDVVRILIFNQQERDPAPLLRALFASVQDRGLVFTHAFFTRNEEQPAEGEDRDLSVQSKTADTMGDIDPTTKVAIYDAVQPAVEQISGIAKSASLSGKKCKVLVTGSFHLVGPALKAIGEVEY